MDNTSPPGIKTPPGDLSDKTIPQYDIARIAKSRCTSCQADLTRIISEIKAGTTAIPTNCPSCHARFVRNRITELVTVLRCGGCNQVLPAGGAEENIYCRHCGSLLDWSDVQPKRG